MALDFALFDLDGTLTDPVVGIEASYRHALEAVGRPLPADHDLRSFVGPPIRENFRSIGLPEELVEDAVTAMRERHTTVGLFEAEVVPGIPELLAALTDDGVRLAVATAKPTRQAERTLEHFGLDGFVPVVAGAPLHGLVTKAEIIAEALAALGHPDPAVGVMVGDRVHDVEGAHAHGLPAIWVDWGYGTLDEQTAARPEHVVPDPVELLALLRRL